MNKVENFGKKAKDKVTGFTGIITALTVYMYGCEQYLITPPVDKDGKRVNGEWFDSGRIELIDDGIKPESVQNDNPGSEYREHPSE